MRRPLHLPLSLFRSRYTRSIAFPRFPSCLLCALLAVPLACGGGAPPPEPPAPAAPAAEAEPSTSAPTAPAAEAESPASAPTAAAIDEAAAVPAASVGELEPAMAEGMEEMEQAMVEGMEQMQDAMAEGMAEGMEVLGQFLAVMVALGPELQAMEAKHDLDTVEGIRGAADDMEAMAGTIRARADAVDHPEVQQMLRDMADEMEVTAQLARDDPETLLAKRQANLADAAPATLPAASP